MNLSKKITEICYREGVIKKEDVEAYEYCFNAVLEFGSNIAFTLLLGIVLKQIGMTVLFLIIVIPLRSCAGGWHAQTTWGCFALSMMYYLGVILSAKQGTLLSEKVMLLFFIGFLLFIWFTAPVACAQKPMNEIEKQKMRKMTRVILLCVTIIFGILQVFHCKTLEKEILLILFVVSLSLLIENVREKEKIES